MAEYNVLNPPGLTENTRGMIPCLQVPSAPISIPVAVSGAAATIVVDKSSTPTSIPLAASGTAATVVEDTSSTSALSIPVSVSGAAATIVEDTSSTPASIPVAVTGAAAVVAAEFVVEDTSSTSASSMESDTPNQPLSTQKAKLSRLEYEIRDSLAPGRSTATDSPQNSLSNYESRTASPIPVAVSGAAAAVEIGPRRKWGDIYEEIFGSDEEDEVEMGSDDSVQAVRTIPSKSHRAEQENPRALDETKLEAIIRKYSPQDLEIEVDKIPLYFQQLFKYNLQLSFKDGSLMQYLENNKFASIRYVKGRHNNRPAIVKLNRIKTKYIRNKSKIQTKAIPVYLQRNKKRALLNRKCKSRPMIKHKIGDKTVRTDECVVEDMPKKRSTKKVLSHASSSTSSIHTKKVNMQGISRQEEMRKRKSGSITNARHELAQGKEHVNSSSKTRTTNQPTDIDQKWALSLVGLRLKVPEYWWPNYFGSTLYAGRIAAVDFSDKAERYFLLTLDNEEDNNLYPMRYDAVLFYADKEHRNHARFYLPEEPPANPIVTSSGKRKDREEHSQTVSKKQKLQKASHSAVETLPYATTKSSQKSPKANIKSKIQNDPIDKDYLVDFPFQSSSQPPFSHDGLNSSDVMTLCLNPNRKKKVSFFSELFKGRVHRVQKSLANEPPEKIVTYVSENRFYEIKYAFFSHRPCTG